MSAAIDVVNASQLPEPQAMLHVERAEAILSCGRLAEARVLFDHAVSVAEREDDPACLARAAIGLGGMWVSEQRSPEARARVPAMRP